MTDATDASPWPAAVRAVACSVHAVAPGASDSSATRPPATSSRHATAIRSGSSPSVRSRQNRTSRSAPDDGTGSAPGSPPPRWCTAASASASIAVAGTTVAPWIW